MVVLSLFDGMSCGRVALETIKQYIFNTALNLETFIDDNISNIDFNNN